MPDFMIQNIIEMIIIATVFIAIGTPLVRAFARRLDRGGAQRQNLNEVTERLQRIEAAVDTIAIEVERSAEAQRFTAKLLVEKNRDPTTGRGADETGRRES